MQREEWRKCANHTNYAVSSWGRVKRVKTVRGKAGNLLKGFIVNGYVYVTLSENGKAQHEIVNRLVCEAWHGPPPFPKAQAAHWNGIRSGNRPENLRWTTNKQNCTDRKRHGTENIGSKNGRAKLTEREVKKIRSEKSPDRNYLAAKYRVSYITICTILLGRTWKHVR